ncbi:hypothetical protein MLD38_026323 [Melastoma candidum]|uniref:Uncharacterized protein n=1 Tax=Melastoma candidum TaxID=119954 RepID=A0ACB9NY42_9MYRT|nr:hypothetical protein MLD38_026323 [Melastoma candidum]
MKGKGGPQNSVCRYRGVRQRTWGRWVAEIRQPVLSSSAVKGKAGNRLWLGTFSTDVEAAFAYDEAARAIYGPLARINFPPPDDCAASSSSTALGNASGESVESGRAGGDDDCRKAIKENMDSSAFFVVDSSSGVDRLAGNQVLSQDCFAGSSSDVNGGDDGSVNRWTRGASRMLVDLSPMMGTR